MAGLMTQLLGKSSLALLSAPDLGSTLSNFVFFKVINDFLRNEIDVVQWKLLTNSASVVGFVGVVVLTVWIMFQGYRIVTGQSQQPMMALVGDSLKAALILMVATTAAYSSSSASVSRRRRRSHRRPSRRPEYRAGRTGFLPGPGQHDLLRRR